jgi:hypothetical protein
VRSRAATKANRSWSRGGISHVAGTSAGAGGSGSCGTFRSTDGSRLDPLKRSRPPKGGEAAGPEGGTGPAVHPAEEAPPPPVRRRRSRLSTSDVRRRVRAAGRERRR